MHKLQEFLHVTQYMGKIAKPHTPYLTKINSAKLPNTALDLKKKKGIVAASEVGPIAISSLMVPPSSSLATSKRTSPAY